MLSKQESSHKLLLLCTSPQWKLFGGRHLRFIRPNSTVASPTETDSTHPSPADHSQSPSPTQSSSQSPKYKIKASVLLSRPPLLTRDLTPFEKAYFLYQRRLNERLVLPFSRYFYYKKGTTGDVEWKQKMRLRPTAAREIGRYNAYGREAWNDELLVGDQTSEPSVQVARIILDAEAATKGKEGTDTTVVKIERPKPRSTEADEKGEKGTLNRLFTRTLYLLVRSRGQDGQWIFPENDLLRDESLHKAAERIIVQTGGINMNTWVVGNVPVGHQVYKYDKPIQSEEKGMETWGEKTFFMKARIMAGKPNLKNNKFDLEDYQWLAKDEIQQVLEPEAWRAVKNSLAER